MLQTAIASNSVHAPSHFAQQLRPGLVLRCSASRHGHGTQQHRGANAGLHLVMVLQGQVHVAYDGRPLLLNSPGAATAGPDAALVSLAEPASFARLDGEGGQECKLSLEAGPDWLQQSGLVRPRAHLAAARWRSGHRMRQLAQGMMARGRAPQGLEQLRLECLTLELLTEVLSLEQQPAPLGMDERMHQARELLDSGAADRWSLADIALELGLHENTLQRRFRQAQGCSVFDYLRQRRLWRARELLRQGASVTQAALDTGYDNPANFATAFKRQFGLSPSQVQD